MADADPRIRQVKAALAKGVKAAAEILADPEIASHSTKTRKIYKAKADAADAALAILSPQKAVPKAPVTKPKAATAKPAAKRKATAKA